MSVHWQTFHFRRQVIFGVIGVSSMLIGSYGSLFVFANILGFNKIAAYALQAFVAIELNFTLNHLITWRDRPVLGWGELGWRFAKFNSTRVFFTVPFNLALFTLLVTILDVQYLIANTICIATTTVINYFVSDRFVFKLEIKEN